MIVLRHVYRAWQVGSTLRRVSCEKCSQEYFYDLVRVGTGEAATLYALNKSGASEAAAVQANNRLQDLLNYCHDPVPCPQCGTIQKKMRWQVALVRARRWVIKAIACWVFSMIACAISLAVAGVTRVGWWGFATCAVAALAGIISFYFRRRRYDEASFQRIPKHHKGLLAPPALLPRMIPGGKIILTPVTVPKLDAESKELVVQLARHGLPGMCMDCLAPTKHYYCPSMLSQGQLSVPCCDSCARRRKRLTWAALLGTFCCLFSVYWLALNSFGPRGTTRDMMLVLGSVPILILAFYSGSYAGYLLAAHEIDEWRGWYALRTRHKKVKEKLAEFYSQPALYTLHPTPE